MKEIANRLGTEGWSLIDVTLEPFGLPTSDTWSGSVRDYVLHMIGGAHDDVLASLALHVGFHFDESPAPQGVDPPFWRKGMLRVFITHFCGSQGFRGRFADTLLTYGTSGFVAHSDIEPTTEWQTQIETALSTCDALVALLHPKFHQSHWTDQEIGFAMGRGVAVFSVRFGQDPYGFIGRFQEFNGNGKTAKDIARELFDAYRHNRETQRRMAEILVNLFEDSDSYAEAKGRIGFLENIDVWGAIPFWQIKSRSSFFPICVEPALSTANRGHFDFLRAFDRVPGCGL